MYEKGKPEPDIKAKELDNRIRGNNDFIQPAINNEHNFVDADANNQSGDHTQGSARCFFAATAPAVRIDTTSFVETDNGSLWVNTSDNALSILTDYSEAVAADKWTLVSDDVIAVLLAANRVFAGTLGITGVTTMSEVPVFTKGVVANDAYLQGLDNAGTGTDDIIKLTVSDRVMIKHSAAKPATLATDDPPANGADIANRKFVSDNVPLSLAGANDSIGETQIGAFQIKWGKKTVGVDDSELIVFTSEGLTAFSTSCFQMIACGTHSNTSASGAVNATVQDRTQCTVYNNSVNQVCKWFAIGI